jgi:hypothetical protein
MIAMVDTMIFDALVADAAGRASVLAAITEGRLLLRTTHIQEDQLADIPDAVKVAEVNEIPREVVPTSVMVWGVSRWGMADWGGSADYEAIRHEGRHVQDAIIGATAATKADVLVTEDKRLRSRATARQIAVWSMADLIAWATV